MSQSQRIYILGGPETCCAEAIGYSLTTLHFWVSPPNVDAKQDLIKCFKI